MERGALVSAKVLPILFRLMIGIQLNMKTLQFVLQPSPMHSLVRVPILFI